LRTQGTVERLSVTVSGSGNAKLADVAVRRLSVKISGSGSVEAAPRDEADITISGSGNVRLLSHPARLKTRVAGSGQIIQASLEAADGKK
jgi:Putative auto-transporter adhesin, head GIN domain